MSLPVALRPDYDAVRLRRLARRSKDAPQTRRLLALAVIYEGGSRTQAAEIGGVSLQTERLPAKRSPPELPKSTAGLGLSITPLSHCKAR